MYLLPQKTGVQADRKGGVAGLASGKGIGAAAVPGHELVQDDRELMQAVQVSRGQLLQYALAFGGQADPYHAAVVTVWCPFYQARGLGAVDELHGAVRPQEQVAGEITNGGRRVSRVSLDRHQQLVLNMGEARGLRLVFAPALEAPQGDTELE